MSIFWGICHTESCPVDPSSCAVGGLGEWSRSFVDAQLRRWGGDHFQVCRRKPLRSLCYWSLYSYSLLAEITREADSLMQVCWGVGGGRGESLGHSRIRAWHCSSWEFVVQKQGSSESGLIFFVLWQKGSTSTCPGWEHSDCSFLQLADSGPKVSEPSLSS